MALTKEMQEKLVFEKKAFIKGLPGIVIAMIVTIILALFVGIVGGIIGTIIFLLVIFLTVYFIWAPNDVFATFPEEGYATIIVESMGFKKIFIKKKGYALNSKSDIVSIDPLLKDKDDWGTESEETNDSANHQLITQKELLGMCFFFWPFNRVYVYRFKWVKYGEDEKSIDKEEVLNHVLLKSYVYYIGLSQAEDAINFPVDIGLAVEMKVVNAYKALFKMQNWFRGVSNFIQGEIRNEVRKHVYSDLIALQEGGKVREESIDDIFEDKLKKLRNSILEEYGIKILKIKIVQIVPSNKELANASTKKALAIFEAESRRILADAQAYVLYRKTIGPIIAALVNRLGFSEQEIQKQMQTDPIAFEMKYKSVLEEIRDMVQRQAAIDGGQFLDIRTPGDPSGMIAMMALLLKGLTDKGTKNSNSSTSLPKEKKIAPDSEERLSKKEMQERSMKSLGFDK